MSNLLLFLIDANWLWFSLKIDGLVANENWLWYLALILSILLVLITIFCCFSFPLFFLLHFCGCVSAPYACLFAQWHLWKIIKLTSIIEKIKDFRYKKLTNIAQLILLICQAFVIQGGCIWALTLFDYILVVRDFELLRIWGSNGVQ